MKVQTDSFSSEKVYNIHNIYIYAGFRSVRTTSVFLFITPVDDVFRVIQKFHVDLPQLQPTRFCFRSQAIINYNDIIAVISIDRLNATINSKSKKKFKSEIEQCY